MKIPRDVNGSEAAKALGRLGFEVRRQAGSHLIMRKDARTVMLPLKGRIHRSQLRWLGLH